MSFREVALATFIFSLLCISVIGPIAGQDPKPRAASPRTIPASCRVYNHIRRSDSLFYEVVCAKPDTIR